jgi:hypothetical protein
MHGQQSTKTIQLYQHSPGTNLFCCCGCSSDSNRIDICINPAFALDLMKQAVTIIVQMIAWSVNVF